MRNRQLFSRLDGWSPERDSDRRSIAEKFLNENNIKFSSPAPGSYKLESNNQTTVMFYPKSATIIWKKDKRDYRHRFVNEDPEKILSKLNDIL